MNFQIVLFILVLVTGISWFGDKLIFFKNLRQIDNISKESEEHKRLRNYKLQRPWWLEYTASFFPVIFLVFLVRSFIVEPFKIPSSSMTPTLVVGDFILVNKFNYGLRLPIINKKITKGSALERGDIVVFRYPKDKYINYIKRVIGLPGDTIEYQDKKLRINGKPVPEIWLTSYFDNESKEYLNKFEENLDNKKNEILKNPLVSSLMMGTYSYLYRDNCTYNSRGMTCKIPLNHYFMMGDNRDNSADSRYWGFVSDNDIVGRAFFIWMNFKDLTRIGFI
ncbi:MAG: signal peptidase I [Burkholderia sp.]|nr:signal peptidase I [Burkholderia sp.]